MPMMNLATFIEGGRIQLPMDGEELESVHFHLNLLILEKHIMMKHHMYLLKINLLMKNYTH